MLNHIFVKDLAIVSSLELDFARGMTTLTGETGAGKSILIEALGLVLGDKADTDMIRAGCERAEVVAGFDLGDAPAARDWLAEQDLDDAGECLVRRLLVRSGRSRAYINARPATGAQLQGLGELLVDIHGQHAHQSLLRGAGQRQLLDAYAGQTERAGEVARLFRAYRALDERVTALTAEGARRAAEADLLRTQIDELDALGVTEGELEELDREQKRLANLGSLQETSARLLDRLYESDASLHGELGRAGADLEGLLGFDRRLGDFLELVQGAAIQVEEAASGLRQYLDGLELDPSRMDRVETRLAQVHELARRFRVFPQQIPDTLRQLRGQLAALERDDLAVAALADDRDAARDAFLETASALSTLRARAAERLSSQVTRSMQELGMKGGRFEARVQTGEAASAGAHGLDRPELLVSANPGQPLQPLARVASGGELSRISLCIQVAAAQGAGVPTLVFDEVDVGIGGAVAEIVGRLLRALGASRQVICVTHLPQVAAQADGHLLIRKHSRASHTYTDVHVLDRDARVEEIARMLGGTEITAKTRAHAREMIERHGSEPYPRQLGQMP
jgi:DNA repair protein RecN (Recombination protein N)